MGYVYIMSCQRSQGSPEIYSIWDTYECAIIDYYEYFVKSKYSNLDFMYLFKIPLNQSFSENGIWSNIKLQKTCMYRLKFKSMSDLKTEYDCIKLQANRDEKLSEIGI